MTIKVWVQLLRGGEEIGTPTQIKLEDGSNVDDLRDAVMVKFAAVLSGVVAALLNVSLAREGTEYLRPGQKLQELPATDDDKPLFVHVPALAGGSEQRQLYRVLAEIPNAKNVMCVRGIVYTLAEEHLAFHGSAHYIWYDGETLMIDLYFASEEKAMLFQTSLNLWNDKRPLGPQLPQPKVELRQEANAVHPLERVLQSSYSPADSESPCDSVDKLKGQYSAPATSIDLNDDLSKYQSFEAPHWLRAGRSKAYRLHLKNKGPSYGHDRALANDENNMVAGSWQFHQFLDGLNMDNNMPCIALQPGGVDAEVMIEGHKRRRVHVNIECYDDDVASVMRASLKEGWKRVSQKVFSTEVYVTNPKSFVECLQWKYDNTKKQWQAVQDALDAM